ncbi:MAG: stage III sporulation protein AB [Ruminococcus sp.]|nr:stage III sporulation protein AB [Ruminococcus sp.]
MAVKIIGILFIVFSCGIWGISKSAGLRNSVGECDHTNSMLESISIMIRYNNYEIPRILSEVCLEKNCPQYVRETAELVDKGMDFHLAWRMAVEKYVTDAAECEIMMRFGNELGLSDTEGQMKLIEGISAQISDIKAERAEKYHRYGRVYRAVGLLFGLMAGVILI